MEKAEARRHRDVRQLLVQCTLLSMVICFVGAICRGDLWESIGLAGVGVAWGIWSLCRSAATADSWMEQREEKQEIDGMTVEPRTVEGRQWWIWRRVGDGMQVQASLGCEARVSPRLGTPQRAYRLEGRRWVRA